MIYSKMLKYNPNSLEKFRQCYDRQPYTYYIGWFDINMWYYGVRFNKQAGLIPENDLWINYFTSCEGVQWYREQYGEPDYIAIHKTFNTIFEAQEYETNTLEEFKASGYWDHFINKTTNKSIDPMIGSDHPNFGLTTDQETINKISKTLKMFCKNNPDHLDYMSKILTKDGKCKNCGKIYKRKSSERIDICSEKCLNESNEKGKQRQRKAVSDFMRERLRDEEYKKEHLKRSLHSKNVDHEKRVKNISKTKRNEKKQVQEMSEDNFIEWISKMKYFRKDGKRNPNLVRALKYRGWDIDEYFKNKS